MPARAFDPDLFSRAASARPLLELFDGLPNVFLYVKDREHRFLHLNDNLVSLLGAKEMKSLLGKTDLEVAPHLLAMQYIEEDRRVFTSRKPLRKQAWLVPDAAGMPSWYLSTKLPFFDKRGNVLGLVGAMFPYDHADDAPGDYRRLVPAIDHVLAHYGERVELSELARLCHLSVSQLRRLFLKLFRLTPGDYVLKVRLLMARRKLETTSQPAGAIALDCGFYDQSHFTRAFRESTGMSPLEYRRTHGPQRALAP